MSKSSYWEKRKAELMWRQMERAEVTAKKLSKIYAKASRQLSDSSRDVFVKFKSEYGLSDKDAKKIVKAMKSCSTSKEFITNLRKQNINKDLKPILEEITSSGYAFRLKRYDNIQKEIDSITRYIYKTEKQITSKHYDYIIKDGFNRAMFEIQKISGIAFEFNQPSSKEIKMILNSSWCGNNYSERIWRNTKILAEKLKEEMAINFLTGRSQSELARVIDERFEVGSFNARRLVRTETCYFENEAEVMSYEEAGIEKYRFLAILDLRTSRKCRNHDGRVYKLKDKVVGENYPPLHPFCRSTTIAEFDDDWINSKKRIARNSKGENIMMPADMSYTQWYNEYVKTNTEHTLKEKSWKNRYSDKRQFEKYKNLGYNGLKSFEKFQDMKYNDTKEWNLVKGYVKTVQKGEISPLVKYKNFKKYHNELENKLIGMKTTDGVQIKSVSYHFTGRAIGTHDWANTNNSKKIMKRLNHKHVPNDALLKCVQDGKLFKKTNESCVFYTDECQIAINPHTGNLVQCNRL